MDPREPTPNTLELLREKLGSGGFKSARMLVHSLYPSELARLAVELDAGGAGGIAGGGEQAKAVNREGIKSYQQQRFPEALELFRQASASQPRNISYALNTAQSLLRLLAQAPDEALKSECLRCLEQAQSMPSTDKRHERYRKLRKAAEEL